MNDHTGATLAAYVRVSAGARERERKDRLRSPEQQLDLMTTAADAKGATLRQYPYELDVTGSRKGRPVLDQIIADMEAGVINGVMVARLNRLSRMKPRDRVEMFERIEEAGGIVLSASEDIDPSTPEGRFAREVFLSAARMEWEKFAEGFAVTKSDAVDRGAKVGPTPFGYLRGPGSVLVVCDTEAPIVYKAFGMAGAGRPLAEIVAYVRETAPCRLRDSHRDDGVRKAGDQRNWTHKAVRQMLANRSYLGEVRYGTTLTNLSAHPAIVTRTMFEAAHAALTAPKRRAARADFPLSGVLTCASCGDPLIGSRSGTPPRRSYRCGRDGSRRDGRGNVLTCDAKAWVNAEGVEGYLMEWSKTFPRRRMTEPADPDRTVELEAQLGEAERELDDFLDDTENAARLRRLGRYQRAEDARIAAVETLQAALREEAQRRGRRSVIEPDCETPAELADLLGSLGVQVVVRKAGRGVREIAPRVAIVLEGDEPPAMPAA